MADPTKLQQLRRLIKDNPVAIVKENLGGDAQEKSFIPFQIRERGKILSLLPVPEVFVGGVLKSTPADYIIVDDQVIKFVVAPLERAEINYSHLLFSDAELTDILFSNSDHVGRAEVDVLIALATDTAKFFAKFGVQLQDDKSDISERYMKAAEIKLKKIKEIGSKSDVGVSGSQGMIVDQTVLLDDFGRDLTDYENADTI